MTEFGVTSNVRYLLKRLKEKNLILNKNKCQFNKISIEFLGHIFSANGVTSLPNKIKAIRDMSSPKSQGGVRSLLRMLYFCSAKFIQHYVMKIYELRKLIFWMVWYSWKSIAYSVLLMPVRLVFRGYSPKQRKDLTLQTHIILFNLWVAL